MLMFPWGGSASCPERVQDLSRAVQLSHGLNGTQSFPQHTTQQSDSTAFLIKLFQKKTNKMHQLHMLLFLLHCELPIIHLYFTHYWSTSNT